MIFRLSSRDPVEERRTLLQMSAGVSSGTIGVAILGYWLTDTPWRESVKISGTALGIGLMISLPLVGVFFALRGWSFRPVRRVFEVVQDYFGPAFTLCRWWELALVALGAGVSEELLFRGMLAGWLQSYGWWIALLVPNVIFGLLHAATVTYALIAASIGVFLSLCLSLIPGANLLSVIEAHAVYDFVAFLAVARTAATRSDGRHCTPASSP